MRQSYFTRPTWRSALYYAHWLASTTGIRYRVTKDPSWGEWIIRRVGS